MPIGGRDGGRVSSGVGFLTHVHIPSHKLNQLMTLAIEHDRLGASRRHQYPISIIAKGTIRQPMAIFRNDTFKGTFARLIHARKIVHAQVCIQASHRKSCTTWIHCQACRAGSFGSIIVAAAGEDFVVGNFKYLRHWQFMELGCSHLWITCRLTRVNSTGVILWNIRRSLIRGSFVQRLHHGLQFRFAFGSSRQSFPSLLDCRGGRCLGTSVLFNFFGKLILCS